MRPRALSTLILALPLAAIGVFWLAMVLLPHLLLYPLLGILMPLSALAGVSYAWLYNRQGGRTSLVDAAKKQLPGKR